MHIGLVPKPRFPYCMKLGKGRLSKVALFVTLPCNLLTHARRSCKNLFLVGNFFLPRNVLFYLGIFFFLARNLFFQCQIFIYANWKLNAKKRFGI